MRSKASYQFQRLIKFHHFRWRFGFGFGAHRLWTVVSIAKPKIKWKEEETRLNPYLLACTQRYQSPIQLRYQTPLSINSVQSQFLFVLKRGRSGSNQYPERSWRRKAATCSRHASGQDAVAEGGGGYRSSEEEVGGGGKRGKWWANPLVALITESNRHNGTGFQI